MPRFRPGSRNHVTVMAPRLLRDWEAAHAFLEVARSGSFRAATEKLHQSVNALRRKVDELEARMGFALLQRRASGVALTEEGRKVFSAALDMEKAAFDIAKAQGESGEDGEVTVAVTEGLGSFWLTSKLPQFLRANPNMTLNLKCAMQVADVMRLEADIAVRLDRPKSSELKISKLGRLHAIFYAHRSYLEAHGAPASLDELFSSHRLVLQCDAAGKWVVSEPHFFPGGVLPRFSVRPNNGSGNGWAIIHGAGIGILPTYAETICTDLVMLDLVPPFAYDVWITYHADAKKIPRVRKTIEWLTEAFDPRVHPWFRDEFIHPRKFPKTRKGGADLSAARDRKSKRES